MKTIIYIENGVVNDFTQDAPVSWIKWLQKWIFVPYVFCDYQSGDITRIYSNPLYYSAVSLSKRGTLLWPPISFCHQQYYRLQAAT